MGLTKDEIWRKVSDMEAVRKARIESIDLLRGVVIIRWRSTMCVCTLAMAAGSCRAHQPGHHHAPLVLHTLDHPFLRPGFDISCRHICRPLRCAPLTASPLRFTLPVHPRPLVILRAGDRQICCTFDPRPSASISCR